jgi:hypothetical protein
MKSVLILAAILAAVSAGIGTAEAKSHTRRQAWQVHHRLPGHHSARPKYRIVKKCQTASCLKKHPTGYFVPHHLKDSQ